MVRAKATDAVSGIKRTVECGAVRDPERQQCSGHDVSELYRFTRCHGSGEVQKISRLSQMNHLGWGNGKMAK